LAAANSTTLQILTTSESREPHPKIIRLRNTDLYFMGFTVVQISDLGFVRVERPGGCSWPRGAAAAPGTASGCAGGPGTAGRGRAASPRPRGTGTGSPPAGTAPAEDGGYAYCT
jgi:hypothetical protein